ncbi:copper resistance protein B [Euryhalocaulis caribicus]|uniref:copper resistance protein B n=1 Tax=Euryhalocaulis caribicus TaxID=1161401 RepID=UPI0003A28286|nr:copper resistance protein B [Euryhalocaulis caribicus]
MTRITQLALACAFTPLTAFAQTGDDHSESRGDVRHEMGGQAQYMILADRLEWQSGNGDEIFVWDGSAWYGGDYNRVWVETEGETLIDGETEAAEIELLYGRAISPYFDVQAGIRQDIEPDARTYAQVGIQGLAPYWFEVDLEGYLSEEGDFTAAFEAEYDLLLTQRLILQPRIETGFAFQDAPERDLGAGFTELETGVRLRYEIKREIAPYIGVSWSRTLGETASIARSLGEKEDAVSAVIGVRLWY